MQAVQQFAKGCFEGEHSGLQVLYLLLLGHVLTSLPHKRQGLPSR